MTWFALDKSAVDSLIKNLRANANVLEHWVGGADFKAEAQREKTSYNLDRVAKAFADILDELNKAGPHGEGINRHLGAIAEHLEAAARALETE